MAKWLLYTLASQLGWLTNPFYVSYILSRPQRFLVNLFYLLPNNRGLGRGRVTTKNNNILDKFINW